MDHSLYMHRCLELAARGRGLVGNGAMVGAVLVREGKVIAEGWHKGFGFAHAERDLLERYTGTIEPSDILYVNLEPCCHQGKTLPCTQIILERGVKTVVYGMHDPDLRVSGKGRALLEAKNVTVIGPVLRAQCEWFNRGYLSVRTVQRPWIVLKKAQTKDGAIAGPTSTPLSITSPAQNIWSHTTLRALTDAILVGSKTIEIDNPQLTVRYDNNHKEKFESALIKEQKYEHKFLPLRIVLDARFSISEEANVCTDDNRSRTIVIVSPEDLKRDPEKRNRLTVAGVRVIEVPVEDERFIWADLWRVLMTPDCEFFGITSILVEGGQKTWDTFIQEGICDEQITLVGTGITNIE